jgi:hypothetical protein
MASSKILFIVYFSTTFLDSLINVRLILLMILEAGFIPGERETVDLFSTLRHWENTINKEPQRREGKVGERVS